MKQISSYVVLKREYEPCVACNVWRAYFRGTSNRVKRIDGSIVASRVKASDLRFDLLNNEMERGVIV